ncbi:MULTISPECIES: EAL and HDOD domain-containing protein [unclassified Agarivorans]|uniref:EAL and HDOD domain-containing protein n=1 Tax=unclassified Agarivorans TaxID=2636026 RepID=UPI0010D28629|nr:MULTISPECIES: HDOD domain-containing protein [unclassified Agarivorans]MDO6686204.1 HDOD domain-containing protein [Agarivorans sp. 3_MG-2023]MDO6716347.1 HDOD domain-containing protein [Agarivorans sp. 2_MG-2023]MDO6764737.1 HDOD domain-containing protein [Agarivorans sp. 1_MG-2023]GDY24210.1 diguanylate cyclase [Agarivorans sp. Toyoura001]
MNVYTARQAILDRKQRVVAYELLFRDGPDNVYPDIDPHEATSKLIIRTQLNDGLHAITQGKPALINFPEESLHSEMVKLLPSKQVVIEILETAKPSEKLYKRCQSLFHRGYRLAFDDFVYKAEWEPYLKFVRLIKVDIQRTPLEQLSTLFEALKTRKKIKLLAEKVETQEEYQQARDLGFNFFQGYYFCRPEMHVSKDIDASYLMISRLFYAATREDVNINEVVRYFERDTGLSYKLLRFVNSGSLPIVEEMASIKQAVVYIGNTQLRKLVALLASAMAVSHKPRELVRMSVHRARFCELVAMHKSPAMQEAAFLCGLFSLLDALLDKPLSELLYSLPLEQDIRDALCSEQPSLLRYMLLTIKSYEEGHWYKTERLASQLRMDYKQIEHLNLQAMLWSEQYQSLIQPS